MRRRFLIAALGLAVLTGPTAAVLPSAAETAATTAAWFPVTRLAPNVQSASLAVDGRSNVTVVWATS